MKLIHLPYNVGGNPQGLSRHLLQLGIKSETWVLTQNYLNYSADRILFSQNDSFIGAEFKRLKALKYLFVYDAIFYNFGSTLFPTNPDVKLNSKGFKFYVYKLIYKHYCEFFQLVELKVLSLLKKPIFIQFQGDDARQGKYCKENFVFSTVSQVSDGYYSDDTDRMKSKQICLFSKYASKIYSLNPDLLHILPKNAEFLPYSHISLKEWQPFYTQLKSRPLKIGHAPTNRKVKGTELIISALETLKSQGYSFELVLVEGENNTNAKAIYEDLDILIDQLFCGWYGGLAVEAMALGKPVVAYIRNEDLVFIPDQMRIDLPVINANPDTILCVLKSILEMPRDELYNLGICSRRFVEKWHDPIKIAERVKDDINFSTFKK